MNKGCKGCGVQLALKLVLENFGKCLVVISERRHFEAKPSVETENPINLASTLTTRNLCFVDEERTEKSLPLLTKGLRVPYICYNISGEQRFARIIGLKGYSATASIAYPEDLANKIKKLVNGGFLEILTPCPSIWDFDSSNTILISRLAVECGLWPLYEIENRVFSLTHRPARLEPLDRFLSLHKKKIGDQERINKNWKSLDNFWEADF